MVMEMGEEYVYSPFSIRADSSKPARILQDPEGKLWLEYYDLGGQIRRVPLSLIIFPQELGNLKSQIPVQDFFQTLPVSVNAQAITVKVKDTLAMLCASASASVAAGGDGNVNITVSSGETWEVQFTNNIGSGADVSLKEIDVSPDGGTTYYPVSTSHLSNSRLVITSGNVVRATFHNAGAAAETAYLNVVGRKLC
jgi:hypothetical protein